MSILSFKIRKFKSDFPRGKPLKNFLTEKAYPPLRNVVNKKIFFAGICLFFNFIDSWLKHFLIMIFFNIINSWLKHFLIMKKSSAGSWCAPAYLFLPSGSSESPTPTSARSARVFLIISQIFLIIFKIFLIIFKIFLIIFKIFLIIF